MSRSHLTLLHHHGVATRRDLLVDAGQEVLGDTQGVLEQRVVRVARGRVLQEVLLKRGVVKPSPDLSLPLPTAASQSADLWTHV